MPNRRREIVPGRIYIYRNVVSDTCALTAVRNNARLPLSFRRRCSAALDANRPLAGSARHVRFLTSEQQKTPSTLMATTFLQGQPSYCAIGKTTPPSRNPTESNPMHDTCRTAYLFQCHGEDLYAVMHVITGRSIPRSPCTQGWSSM
jgi:hypothetical protein